MISDLRRPTPVLEPNRWVDASAARLASEIHLSLDFVVSIGGPGREVIERILETSTATQHRAKIVWYVDPILLRMDRVESEIGRMAARHWIEKTPKPLCFVVSSAERELASSLFKSFNLSEPIEIRLDEKRIPFTDEKSVTDYVRFFREAFPRASSLMFDPELRESLSAYARELPDAFDTAFEGLRFFAGFLRRQKKREVAEAFAFDWAYLRALFSPQDEKLERERLSLKSVIANPTLQLVQFEEEGRPRVQGWFRTKGIVHEASLDVFAAALLDQVHENPRSSKDDILREALRETHLEEGELHKAFARLCSQDLLLIGD